MRVARTDFRVLVLEVFLFFAMKPLCRELHKRRGKSLSALRPKNGFRYRGHRVCALFWGAIGRIGRMMAGAKIGFHPRRRESTPDAPGMGAGEIRLRRALNAAADLPRFTGTAGPGLIHGLPPLVTTAVWLACAKPPIMSKPWTACRLVTAFIPCQRSRKVEAIQAHHLGPGRDKVLDELVLSVGASIDFSQGAELGV